MARPAVPRHPVRAASPNRSMRSVVIAMLPPPVVCRASYPRRRCINRTPVRLYDVGGRSPDPVEDPQAYQEHLLGLLGDDDPAGVQAKTPGEWRTLVHLAGPSLHEKPADGEWSVFGCLAHAVDAEV